MPPKATRKKKTPTVIAKNPEHETGYWVRNESDKYAVKQGCYFDYESADRVRQFLKQFCRHSKGQFAGVDFELLPWQWQNVVAPGFGWKMEDGTRRFKEINIFIPKKNGKTTLSGALALYLATADDEPGAEVYLAAFDRPQAKITFNEIVAMVLANEELEQTLIVEKSKHTIQYPEQNSVIRAISADANRNEGLNIHALLFDELHTQRTRALWAALKYGGAARRQPLRITTSTAGELDESSLWWEVFQNALAIQDGKIIDIHTLPVVFAMRDNEDWHNPKTWERVNPSWGVTINPKEFQQAYNDALKNGANESEFKRYRLNKATVQVSTWIQNQYWEDCKTQNNETIDLNLADEIFGGLDLSDNTDMNAFTMVGSRNVQTIDEKTGITHTETIYDLSGYFWVPSELLTINNNIIEKYRFWQTLGLLRVVPGRVVEQEIVENDIVNIIAGLKKPVISISVDRFQAGRLIVSLQNKLVAKGLRTKINPCGYNFVAMNEPTKELENWILKRKLRHNGNKVLNDHFVNVVCVQDSNGNKKLDKSNRKKKIDGFASLCCAVRGYIDDKTGKRVSKYADGATKLQTTEI